MAERGGAAGAAEGRWAAGSGGVGRQGWDGGTGRGLSTEMGQRESAGVELGDIRMELEALGQGWGGIEWCWERAGGH